MPEQLIFRGIIFRLTECAFGTAYALGLSGLLFAAVHLDNHGIMPTAVLATVWPGWSSRSLMR